MRELKKKINDVILSRTNSASERGDIADRSSLTVVWKDIAGYTLDREDKNIDRLSEIIVRKGESVSNETFSISFEDNKIIGINLMMHNEDIEDMIKEIGEVCRDANYHDFEVFTSAPMPKEVTESTLYGKDKTSYQDLGDNLRLVIKHGATVNPEVRGSRSRNIKKIYVECDGERSVLPTTSTRLARGLARHWKTAGSWEDDFGQHILNQLDLYRKLNKTLKYINSNKINNDEATALSKHAALYRRNLSSWFDQLQTDDGYNQCSCNYSPLEQEEDVDSIRDALTVKLLDPEVEEILPLLSSITKQGKQSEEEMLQALKDLISSPLPITVEDIDPRSELSDLTEMTDDEIITKVITAAASRTTDPNVSNTLSWCLDNQDTLTPELKKGIFRSYGQSLLNRRPTKETKEGEVFDNWVESKINPDYLK